MVSDATSTSQVELRPRVAASAPHCRFVWRTRAVGVKQAQLRPFPPKVALPWPLARGRACGPEYSVQLCRPRALGALSLRLPHHRPKITAAFSPKWFACVGELSRRSPRWTPVRVAIPMTVTIALRRKLVTRHYGAVTTFVTVLVSGAAPASHLGGVRFWGWRLRPCSHTGEKPLCVKGDL